MPKSLLSSVGRQSTSHSTSTSSASFSSSRKAAKSDHSATTDNNNSNAALPQSSSSSSSTSEDEEGKKTRREKKIVQRLAQRAYHLEEQNSWTDDWVQYQRNTHPVFGLFLYHPLHPIRLPQRVIILIGSIACGFAITNCIYLGLLEEGAKELGLDNAYNATGNTIVDIVSDVTTIEINRSVFYLLTIGSFVHSAFDMTIWYLMACFCFRPGGFKINRHCQTVGIYVAVLVVLLAIGGATYFVLLRLNEDVKNQADYEATDSEEFADGIIGDNEAVSRFSFFVGYALELVCALFLFYFVTSTVFFTGILGCGRVPILGGRPYEIWREKMATDDDDKKSSDDESDIPGLQTYGV